MSTSQAPNSGEKKGMGPVGRIVLSAVVVFVYGWLNFLLNAQGTILSGQVAGRQFENSDAAYVQSLVGMNFFSNLGLPFIALLLILLWIWWKPLKAGMAVIAIILAIGIVAIGSPAKAYYDQMDYTEVYFILPNESAFWIPDVGANKDSQTNFGSEEYYKANKIAAKRFQIPHAKLSGSSNWANYYVPTGRLVIVDRTPYAREWVKASHRGTSNRDDSFPCQSKEGLDITVGIAIGASVFEEEAPKFLYHFGVKTPQGDRSKPEVIFTSVYYGRSLTEVMDGIVRSKIQSLVCDEFTGRSFDEANLDAKQLMATVRQNVAHYLADVGIHLDHIGWADTFEFAPEVQGAINRRYAATKDREIAELLSQYTDFIRTLAAAQAIRDFGAKTDGKLPTTFVGPSPDMTSPMLGLPSAPTIGRPAPAAPTTAPAPAAQSPARKE